MEIRNSHARWRAALAAAGTVLLALSTGAAGQVDGPAAGREDAEDARGANADEAMDRLRAQVQAQADRLRAELDAHEAGRDWGELLERKCTVDAAFSPVHFLLDALEWGDSPGDPAGGPDLLRALRTEWKPGPVLASWSHPDAPERVRQSLSAWVPADGSGRAPEAPTGVRLEVRTGSERWVRGDAPLVMRWTIDADRRAGAPTIHARCWWRMPLAEPRRIDFPLPGDGFDLWMDRTGARYADDRGGSHDERWERAPIFNNPPELYAAFDSLRLAAAPDRALLPRPAGGDGDLPPTGDADGEHVTRTRRIVRADGSPVRTERWYWEHGRLRSVTIEQESLRLLHHAEQGAEIVTEVAGNETGRTAHRATSELVHFPAGARIDIAFRNADPDRDRVHDDPAVATVPDRFLLTVGGARVAWAEFLAVRVRGAGEDADDAPPGLAGESEECRSIAAALGRSVDERSGTEFRDAVARVAAEHVLLGVPMLHRACEWELIAARAHQAGMGTDADQVIVARLLAEAAEDAEAMVRRARERGEASFASRLAQVAGIADAPPAAGSEGTPRVAEPVPGGARTCDGSLLGTGARTIFEALRSEVNGAGVDREAVRSIEDSLCRELTAAGTGLDAHAAANVSWLASEARAVLRSIQGPGDAAAFARCARAAADRAPDGAARASTARNAWDACADAVQAALRSAIARGILDADRTFLDAVAGSVREAMRAQRALVGNPFVPELEAAARDDPPGVDAVRRQMAGAVEAECVRELRRAATVRELLGSVVAEARKDAARRRIARSLVGLAISAYLEWRSGPDARPAPGAQAFDG